jgi:predicted DsbA family dithiol-disulfide isomerase
VKWRGFPLHPETPDEGRSLEELFAGTQVDIGQMMARLRATADSLGLPLGERAMTYNSRLAQELGYWAESLGRGHAFHMAAFKAYFADGLNLARIPVLLDIAESAGLDRDRAGEVLDRRSFRQEVDRDWTLARSLGIVAVPTVVMGLSRLVGAQPYEALERLVTSSGARKRT